PRGGRQPAPAQLRHVRTGPAEVRPRGRDPHPPRGRTPHDLAARRPAGHARPRPDHPRRGRRRGCLRPLSGHGGVHVLGPPPLRLGRHRGLGRRRACGRRRRGDRCATGDRAAPWSPGGGVVRTPLEVYAALVPHVGGAPALTPAAPWRSWADVFGPDAVRATVSTHAHAIQAPADLAGAFVAGRVAGALGRIQAWSLAITGCALEITPTDLRVGF